MYGSVCTAAHEAHQLCDSRSVCSGRRQLRPPADACKLSNGQDAIRQRGSAGEHMADRFAVQVNSFRDGWRGWAAWDSRHIVSLLECRMRRSPPSGSTPGRSPAFSPRSGTWSPSVGKRRALTTPLTIPGRVLVDEKVEKPAVAAVENGMFLMYGEPREGAM